MELQGKQRKRGQIWPPRTLGWLKVDLLVAGEGKEGVTHLLGGSDGVIHTVHSTLYAVLPAPSPPITQFAHG